MLNSWVLRKSVILLMVIGVSMMPFAFDDDLLADLEAMEAEMLEEEAEIEGAESSVETQQASASAPPQQRSRFSGNYRVLVTRPVYAPYTDESGTQWISAISEAFFHYKVSSLPSAHVINPEHVNEVLSNFRNFDRRISRQAYIETAEQQGATHLLYQEYEPQSRNEVRFTLELFSIVDNQQVTQTTEIIDLSELESGLMELLDPIATTIYPDAQVLSAYRNNFLGDNRRVLENLGNSLVDEGCYAEGGASSIFDAVNRIANQNSELPVALFTAAAVASRAGQHSEAIEHQLRLISRSGDHPALHLAMSTYYRRAERFSDATNSLSIAENVPALRVPVALQRAILFQEQGFLNRAKDQYNVVLESGEASGRVFFRLALLSVQLGSYDAVSNYLNRAENAGFALDDQQYFELGMAYADIGNQDENAIQYLRRSLEFNQSNAEAWKRLAEIYKRTGNEKDAAECYINLFHLDNNANRDMLRIAGETYERIGETEKAKDVYSLFLARRFNNPIVSLRLATIYFNEDNCEEATNLLDGIDTLDIIRHEASVIMDECLGPDRGRRVVTTAPTMASSRPSAFRTITRITSGVGLVAGIAGGIIMNNDIKDLEEEYSDAKSQSIVLEKRDEIEDKKLLRNILYSVAGASSLAFTLTIAIPSRK
ncbi:tetratricopeptide repeat protein [Chitinispirillales bacterium ANBcel5]|uniref:tetratricopeptide repeat protein n=1 Tax=Cellulosispirillum alkaliphilum TaxID=3039283 RepID=UPI002A527F05|nr:tetratricopeptide repeat protein [Chitinispirillales bacterium ANBcel5]